MVVDVKGNKKDEGGATMASRLKSVFSVKHDTGDIEEGKSESNSMANDDQSRDIETAQEVSFHKASVSNIRLIGHSNTFK